MKLRYRWLKAKSYRESHGERPVTGIILHSTDGHRAGDIETLTEGNVSVHWYVTRDGSIYHFVADNDVAYHAGVTTVGWGNATTIGIEQEHIDHRDNWPEAQVRSAALIVAFERQKYGKPLKVKSHAEIATPPGRKEDPVGYPWSDLSKYVKEYMEEVIDAVEVD